MSTHDLSLLHIPEIADFSDKIHFQESFVVKNGKAEMSFDYRIREGETQSRNAIALMKHIGLELEELIVREIGPGTGALKRQAHRSCYLPDLFRPTKFSLSIRVNSRFQFGVHSRFKRKHGGIDRDAADDRAAVQTSDENSGLNDFDPRNRAQSQP